MTYFTKLILSDVELKLVADCVTDGIQSLPFSTAEIEVLEHVLDVLNKEREIDAYRKAKERLLSDLADARARIASLHRDIESLESQYSDLFKKNENASVAIQQKNDEIKKLNICIVELKAQLKED